jgi:hypothetical protein
VVIAPRSSRRAAAAPSRPDADADADADDQRDHPTLRRA